LKRDMHLAKRYYDLAAETSPDAAVPVALARLKLALVYFVENFKLSNIANSAYEKYAPTRLLGPDWDLYLMTFLAALLGIVVYLRRVPNP